MNAVLGRLMIVGLVGSVASLGCRTATPAPASAPPPSAQQPAPSGTRISLAGRYPHSPADIHFMTGMVPHHAQAVKIASWAESRAASQSVRVLAERIVVAQRDEIALIRSWLREIGAPVPASDATHMSMTMNGMQHDMLMPGMLSDAELAQLDRARGTAFDRLFLTFMIRHHDGAVTMVDQLFASHGAAQDEVVFKFASDVYADQTTEIDRMQKMLEALPPGDDAR